MLHIYAEGVTRLLHGIDDPEVDQATRGLVARLGYGRRSGTRYRGDPLGRLIEEVLDERLRP